MAPTLFFSYSHIDEALRNQLEVHLFALKRQGLISTWHDRRIIVGSHVGDAIDANLEAAQIILLLVSSDFIASDYCYEREMMRAMERQESGDARVIPVILRPCDWHDLRFGKLLAAPRDGNPRHGGMNEAVSVKADDQTLYFQALGMQSYGRREKEKLSAQGAAELFWDLFIRDLQ
jgi:hypothetical protein